MANMIRLILPYPVSANRYWRAVRLGDKRMAMVPTKEAKAYKQEVGWLAKKGGIGGPVRYNVALAFRLVPANGICMDLDNALKVTIDALKDVAYFDDKQVRKITAERCEPDGHARLEVVIEQYEPPAPALFQAVPLREAVPF